MSNMSKKYRVYKPKLRVEFSHRCAYCETREPEIGGSKSFHIDHYKPKKLFPELIYTYNNLIYSCRDCNDYKRDYWPNRLERLLKKFILNPRKDQINKHINTSGFAWSGKTAQGKWTVTKLRLDSVALSLRREDRTRLKRKIQQMNAMIEDAKQRLHMGRNLSSSERQSLENFIEEETKNTESFKRKIFGPMD